jgi:phosphocarrier protein HPr
MLEKNLTITNKTGLHARPASLLVNMIKSSECDITIKFGEKSANAKSMLNLLALGLKNGSEITVVVNGEKIVCEQIVNFLSTFTD